MNHPHILGRYQRTEYAETHLNNVVARQGAPHRQSITQANAFDILLYEPYDYAYRAANLAVVHNPWHTRRRELLCCVDLSQDAGSIGAQVAQLKDDIPPRDVVALEDFLLATASDGL